MSPSSFSVLLDDPEVLATPARLTEVARVVAGALGEPVSDAATRIRYGHGILVRDVFWQYAKEIARGLAQLGLGSFTVEGGPGGFAMPPRPRRLGTIDVSEEGVELGVRFKPVKTHPWKDVLAIHAHATKVAPGSDESDALPRGGRRTTDPNARKVLEGIELYEERERTRLRLGIDFLLSGPVLYRMSIDTPGIYAKVGAAGTALESFLKLLGMLHEAAGEGVLLPPGTRRLLTRHDVGDILFPKPEELDSFNAWLLHAKEHGIRYGEPEDVLDDALMDEEEAVVVDAADADDALDLDDAELEDSGEELEDDAEEPAGEAEAEAEDALADEDLDDADLADADLEQVDVSDVLEHFNQTTRLEAGDIKAMLSDADDLDPDDVESLDPDAEDIGDAMGFFDASSGAWDVTKLLDSDGAD